MGIENNEKDINRSGSEEQKNTPKKKLNIVFRKQFRYASSSDSRMKILKPR